MSQSDETGRSTTGPRALVRGNVLWLSVISLLNDTASEMIYPLLPVFLVGVLGAGPAVLGLIEGIAETTASVVKFAGGWLSDRIRRRKVLVGWGYGIASAARPLVALATAPWHVLAVRFTDRVGKGVRTAPRDALLAGSVAAGRRGTAFGVHRAADHAGAVAGPLIAAGILLLAPDRLRLVFALAAIPGALAVLALLRVREVVPAVETGDRDGEAAEPFDRGGGTGPSADATDGSPASAAPGGAARSGTGGEDAVSGGAAADAEGAVAGLRGLRRLGRTFPRYLGVLLIFTLGNASDAFLLLRADQLGVPVALVPLLWAVHHVSKSAWSVPGGMVSDRFGPKRTIVAGWLVYAAAYAGFAFADAGWHVWALFAFYGLFFGLTEAPEKALVARLAPGDLQGAAFGAYHFAIGIGALPASLLFGAIWELFGAPTAFLVGAGLALLAALLLPLALRLRG